MLVIGFSEAEVVSLYELVACVLKLGNLQFKHHANLDGTDGCRLLNQNGACRRRAFSFLGVMHET